MLELNEKENKGLGKRFHYKQRELKDVANPPQRHPYMRQYEPLICQEPHSQEAFPNPPHTHHMI
jgi:hypothetical protein